MWDSVTGRISQTPPFSHFFWVSIHPVPLHNGGRKASSGHQLQGCREDAMFMCMCFTPLEGPRSQRRLWLSRLFSASSCRTSSLLSVLAVPKRTLGTVQSAVNKVLRFIFLSAFDQFEAWLHVNMSGQRESKNPKLNPQIRLNGLTGSVANWHSYKWSERD